MMTCEYSFHSSEKLEITNEMWDEYLLGMDSATFFHKSDWLEFVGKYFKVRLSKYIIFCNGEMIGLFPAFEKRIFLLKILGSPLVAENNPYLGFIFNQGVDVSLILEEINKLIVNEHISFVRLSFDSFVYAKEFLENGYMLKEKKSFCINLNKEIEILWNQIGQKGRNLVRKAEKNNFKFRYMTGDQFNKYYYIMCENVYKKQNAKPILARSYYHELYQKFSNKDSFSVFCIKDEYDQPVAAAIIVNFKKTAYYLDGVSLSNYQKYGVNNYLQWNIILQLKKIGIEKYDLLGGDIVGIAKFKSSLGAQEFKSMYVDKTFNKFALGAKSVFSKVKKIKRKKMYFL